MSRGSHPSQAPSVFTRLRDGDPGPSRHMSPTNTNDLKARLAVGMRALGAKDKKRLKESGTRLTEQTAEGPLQLKKNMCRKVNIIEEDTENLGRRSQNLPLMKKIYPNLGCVKKRTRSLCGSVTLNSPKGYKAFLANFLQQKKYIKDPIGIHHIKQRKGESTEVFMERFKAESMHVKGAPECMRVSGVMHGITNPDLIKRLNNNIPKSVDEMMSVTTAFLRGKIVVSNQSRKKGPPSGRHHKATHNPIFDKKQDFKNWKKSGRSHDRFTPLIKTLKEILAMDTVKFKAPPPMSVLIENQNKNKFCEFHGDECHNTDECIYLKKKIEEAIKYG
ncbi:hypothetical protein Tco_0843958 [Tanacetum coccineum]